MVVFLVATVFSFLVYLLLTAGSGEYILVWSPDELIAGVVLATLAGLLVRKLFSVLEVKPGFGFLNPVRWILLVAYVIGPFFYSMVKANLDVAYRVITGKIKPGIVKISPPLETDLGITMLANSITLTPGTLSVDVDEENNLYVHWINVKNKEPRIEEVCSSLHKWVKRITE
jgi:multicomponent Na+:H+ antiporter subunit E